MFTCIADIIDELTESVQPHDHVHLTLTSQTLHHEIWLPFMMPEQLMADRVMVEVIRVVQSNDKWLFDDFYLNFIHAPLPFGRRWSRGSVGCLEAYLTEKKCIIPIHNKGNLCCPRAIVTSKARLDHHPKWSTIRKGKGEQKYLVTDMHSDAGNDVL